MIRKVFFALYGVAVGAVYVTVASQLWALNLNLVVIIGIVLSALLGFLGWSLVRAEEASNLQLLLAMPLIPFVLVASVFGVLVVLSLLAVIMPFMMVKQIQHERRYRKRLRTKARFAKLHEIQARLVAGEGTLIDEGVNKGTIHVWWTADDVGSLGKPVSTNEEYMEILAGKREHPFNSWCLREYLDAESGKAILTSISGRQVKSGKLARRFPNVPIVKVVRPMVETPRISTDKPAS